MSAFVFEEPSLTAENALARFRDGARIGSIRLHDARADFVFEVFGQNPITQPPDQTLFLNREQDFHATIQIARHQVRAADVNLSSPPLRK